MQMYQLLQWKINHAYLITKIKSQATELGGRKLKVYMHLRGSTKSILKHTTVGEGKKLEFFSVHSFWFPPYTKILYHPYTYPKKCGYTSLTYPMPTKYFPIPTLYPPYTSLYTSYSQANRRDVCVCVWGGWR